MYPCPRRPPNETRNITFHLPVDQLAFHDEDLQLIIEPGKINIMPGGSSDDIRLRGEFEIAGNGMMAVQARVFVCPVSIE